MQKSTIKPKRIRKKDTENYVEPAAFREELRNFYTTGNFTNILGNMIKKIAYGMSYAPNFINYTYKDEMICDAIEKMSRAVIRKNFKIDSESNPFNYYSTICFNSFVGRLNKEKEYAKTIDDYKEYKYNELIGDEYEGIYVNNNRNSDNTSDDE